MAQNMKRGRNQRRRSNTNVNRALDSTGPDVKIRGTALQIYDKYQALARDAASSGDRIRAESLLQHAEHYFRLLKSLQPQQVPNQNQQDPSDEPQPDVNNDNGDENSSGDTTEAEKKDQSAGADREETADDSSSDEEEKPKRARRRRPPRKAASSEDEDAKEPSESEAVAAE